MVFDWHFKGFAIGERLINTDLIAQGFEMLHDISNDDFVRASCIVIVTDADVDVRRITIQQIGVA